MLVHVPGSTETAAIWRQWSAEPSAIMAITLVGVPYAIGVRRLWRHARVGHGVRSTQAWCFIGGLATLVLAIASPIDALSDDLFAAHMIQHVLLATIAPPLLVAGGPLVAWLWAVPVASRRRVALLVRNTRWLRASWRVLAAPEVAWLLYAVVLWAWHLPRLYELALRHPTWHAVEHASFVGAGVLLWWRIVHPTTARRTAYAVGMLTIFATGMQSGALGALLTLSHHPWYAVHQQTTAAWGFTPLEDQQIAGLVMWVVGGLLHVLAMSVLFVGWLGASARAPRAQRRADDLLVRTV